MIFRSFQVAISAVSFFLLLLTSVISNLQAQSWTGNGPFTKDIRAVTQAPDNPLVLYAGAFGWGVYRSADGGQTWINDRSGMSNTYVRSILALAGGRVFAGTNEGVFLSTNGGHSWTQSLSTASSVRSLAFDSSTSSLFAGTYGNGLYRSVNLGGSWAHQNVEDPLSGQTLSHIRAVTVAASNLVYAGGSITDITAGGALFKSTNGGTTWKQLQQGFGIRSTVMSIGVSPVTPASILVVGTAGLGTYRSTNAGAIWNTLDGPATVHPLPDQKVGAIAINLSRYYAATDSTAAFYYRLVGDTSNGWLTGGGLPGPPRVVNSVTIDRATPTTVYAGTEGAGIYRSTNSGTAWTPLNQGLLGVFARRVRLNGNGELLCGTQFGDGIWISPDQGSTWSRAESLETANSITALEVTGSPSLLYASAYGSGVYRSTDAGRQWKLTDTSAINRFVRSLAVEPGNPATVYAGTGNGVYKTSNGGETWFQTASGMAPGTSVRSLAVDPLSPSRLFAGTDSSYLYASTNGGAVWSHITDAAGFLAQDVFIRCLTVDAGAPSIVFAGCDSGRVYRSSDAGASWTLLASLPTVSSVRSIVRNPLERGILFAATFGGGIFVTGDSGSTWSTLNAGLPDLEISDLEIDTTVSLTLYAGTGSHGVFRTPYVPGQATVLNLQEEAGWNLVSLPLRTNDGAAAHLFPTASSAAFAFRSTYVSSDTLFPGEGYWLKFPTAAQVQIAGTFIAAETVAVAAGWNLIGSVTTGASPAGVIPVAPLAILSPLYRFGGGTGYAVADQVVPGGAYWVKVSQAGTLIIQGGLRSH